MLTPVTEEHTTAIWENTYAESHSSQYAERIQGDKVQMHLRTVASDCRRKFMADGVSILEVGCSNGYEMSLAKKGFSGTSCVCADVSPEAIEYAKQHSPAGTYDRFVEVSGNWNESIGSFHIIYSTFGAGDTSSFHEIASLFLKILFSPGLFHSRLSSPLPEWILHLP